jgi:predicted RNA binding protein YcfA (HicA-like mRNA interferase family)
MPKFPGLSGADIVRALEKLGFVVARQSGSHILMKRDNQGCVIPNHKEVKIGTVNGILRQAGVSAQEFHLHKFQFLFRWVCRLSTDQ